MCERRTQQQVVFRPLTEGGGGLRIVAGSKRQAAMPARQPELNLMPYHHNKCIGSPNWHWQECESGRHLTSQQVQTGIGNRTAVYALVWRLNRMPAPTSLLLSRGVGIHGRICSRWWWRRRPA